MMEKKKNLNWVVEQLKKSNKTSSFFPSSQPQYFVQADLKQIIDVLENYKHIMTKTNFNPDDSKLFSHNCPQELRQFVLLHDKLNATVKKYWEETHKETDNEISFWLQLYSYILSLQTLKKEKSEINVNEKLIQQQQAIEKIKLQLNEKEQEIKKGEKFLKQKIQAQEERQVSLNQREQKIKEFEESLLKSEKLGRLFNGSIFAGCSEEQQGAKEFLVEKLRLMNDCRPVKRTELLYSFPKFKECQFHPLVDGHQDYVVLVQLENGMKVAGYSKEPLQKGRENRGPGFLASLSNKEVFLLKNTEKAKLTAYNEFFLKFGNSELVIKLCEPRMGPPREEELKVKSNFGGYNTNDFHSGKFKNPEILFGENVKQSKMRKYEIFKIFIEKQ